MILQSTNRMNYIEQLNDPQKAAVLHPEGPLMIIAGAGSGKTRVLTYRIAHLIQHHGVDPFQILALTFTNKAAQEMRHRIEQVVGTEARNIWMGTFHSVFARILRYEADKLGYPSNFTIYDTEDSKSLIKAIVKELNLDDKVYKPNTVLNRISGAKNRLISWQEYNQNPIFNSDDASARVPKMGEIYRIYAQRCFKASAMDFDDLLFNTNVLFRDHLDVLNKYQHRFKHVLVDEFQDTNVSQYLITKKLSAVHRNFCVVGDDAQSIYAFRGADIQNILNFEKDFPEAFIVKLEQNYRSTGNIVEVANHIIKNNSAQLPKKVWTSNGPGNLIEVFRAATDNEEGRLVASSIFEEKMQRQTRHTEMAVLYRTNSQSRALEEALRKMNISYRIIGGLSFYQRKEIKDILAYFRFVINTQDEQAFKRIINLPKRGIGLTSVDKIVVSAFDHDLPIWQVLENISSFVPRLINVVGDFVSFIKRCQIEVTKNDAYQAATFIAQHSGLLKELYADKTVEGLSRYENVQELLNAVKEFVDDPEKEDKSLGAFLQEVALLTSEDTDKSQDNDRVTLMTIHSAKGLEFKNVYVVGMEEELFPSMMMLGSRADLEEERRLFYVAVTRAKSKLFLSHAFNRYRFGRMKTCEPSRFLDEIDPQYLKINHSTKKNSKPELAQHAQPSGQYAKSLVKKAPVKTTYTHQPGADFAPSDTTGLAQGMRVEHPKFGFGTVTNMDVQGANRKAKINFEMVGEKTLLLSFAKLKIHG